MRTKRSLWNLIPYVGGLCAFVVCFGCVSLFQAFEQQRYLHEVRSETLEALSSVRAKAESAINVRTSLNMGLKAFVSSKPDLYQDRKWFSELAASMMETTPGIMNIAICRGTIVKRVWPYDTNKLAVGLDLSLIPGQREAVLEAIHTRQPVLAGPVKLVQGGEGFINRLAVFETNDQTSPDSGPFWGMANVVIDKETLLEEITVNVPPELEIAIRGQDGKGAQGKFFFGDPNIVDQAPIKQMIILPGGSWQILGVPRKGWEAASPHLIVIQAVGITVSGLIAILFGGLLYSNLHYRSARKQAQAASEAKTEFLGKMSHELRTPLTAICGFANELSETIEDKQSREFVKIIRGSGNHLLQIVNDILDVTRIEAHRIEIEFSRVQIRELMADVVETFRYQADRKSLILKVHFEDDVPDTIISDPVRMRQVLVNLLSNAIKFTEEGRIDVRIASWKVSEQETQLIISVRDTGVGIASEFLDRIFEPFWQVDPSTSRTHSGTGLGMVISRHLCKILGGGLTVVSELESGSEFTASFTGKMPLEQPQSISREPGEGRSDASRNEKGSDVDRVSRQLEGLSVLLVEDGPDNQRLIKFLLEKQGASVVVADDGLRAVEFIERADRAQVDLILMDMQMPQMDGYTATRHLRSTGVAIPIIALTAHAMHGEEERCLEAGCDLFHTKPVDRQRLFEEIAELCASADVSKNLLTAR